MKKKHVIIVVVLLVIFGLWINLTGKLWSQYSYELYCLEEFIENNRCLPKDDKEFNNFIETKFKVVRHQNYLTVNYNIDVSKLKYLDGKLYDNENKSVWLVSPQNSILIINPFRWLSCKDDSIEIYELYKEILSKEKK